MSDLDKESQSRTLVNAHQQMLVALRHREQDIFRFLVILGPTIGAYLFLIKEYIPENKDQDMALFWIVTLVLEFVLAVGAWYSVALGFNYRSIELQLKKFERSLNIDSYVLKNWQQKDSKCRWFCTPPEIIKVFWVSFLVAFAGVGVSSLIIGSVSSLCLIIIFALTVATLAFIPIQVYGDKICEIIRKEREL